jgi:peptidyl-prolyl cis-trans isomerase SurA
MNHYQTTRTGQSSLQGGRKLAAMLLCLAAALPQAGAWAQDAKPAAAPAVTPAPVAPAAASTTKLVDSIVAVVNDEVITRQELAGRARTVEVRMRAQNVAVPPLADLQRQLLERMIVERAQIQAAKDVGIRIDDPTLDRAVAKIAEQNKLTLQEFRNQMEHEGTPFAAFREEIRNEITMLRLREHEVDAKVQINDSEVDNFITAEAQSAQTQQELDLAQILVRIPENASAEVIATRRARAEDVLRQLKSGGDFGQMAATYSDSSDALKGGELGWRTPERLPQLFVDAVANLSAGQVSALVKSPNGFHILKLVGKRNQTQAKAAAAAAAVQQTHARHILIKVNQVVSAQDAKRKLIEVKERLDNKAATFEELAKLFSTDGSASKGGDLGWLYPGDTVPEFETAMNALKLNELSDPIETPFGFHLIQVLERKTDDVSRERQRQAARQTLRERRIEETGDEWARQLRDKAYVEYRLDEK